MAPAGGSPGGAHSPVCIMAYMETTYTVNIPLNVTISADLSTIDSIYDVYELAVATLSQLIASQPDVAFATVADFDVFDAVTATI